VQHILDYFTAAVTWTWNTVGWWALPLVAVVAVAAGVVEWRRR
jgi:hypothetical protein